MNSKKYDDKTFSLLEEKLKSKNATIGILGLGYVGLPLLQAFHLKGFPVVGFDVDSEKISMLNNGKSYIHHISSEEIQKLLKENRFKATTDFSCAKDIDVLIICVPTPLTVHRDPDMRFVEETAKTIQPYLKEGHLVILESTTYPGTCDEIVQPILEQSGLKCGDDFFLAYSPEREDPGNPHYETKTIPKVVGGIGERAQILAATLYEQAISQVVNVSSSRTAEAVKLTENIFRCVNIALVNELKVVFEKMGIDIWEVIEAAKTKPFGFMPFYPGPGLGGHCIPIDPFYLTWKAREYGLSTRFIELAGEINTHMPHYVIQRLIESLDLHFSKGLNGSRILIMGLAYKKNVDDMRESPSLVLIKLLRERGAIVDYYDSYIPKVGHTRDHPEVEGDESIVWSKENIASYDAVLISTDHDNVDYDELVLAAKLVIDTRNATGNVIKNREKIVKA